jgi:predicted Zn-dependent protease
MVMSAVESHTTSLLQRATDSVKSGAFDQARDDLLALVNADPAHELATGMLAAVYAEQGRFADAASYFERTLTLNPDNPLARMQLGVMRLQLQQPQAALEAFELGLNRSAYGLNEYVIQFYRAVALAQLQQTDEARAALIKAQEFMPTNHALYPRLLQLLIQLDTHA